MKWMHLRKGLIEGELVKDEGDFVIIKLDDPSLAEELSPRKWSTDGKIMVRKSFLREISG